MSENKDRILKVMLMLEKINDELGLLDRDQAMSTGPIWPKLKELKERVTLQARGYKVVDKDRYRDFIDLTNEAKDKFKISFEEATEEE